MWMDRRSGQDYHRGAQDHRAPYERDRTRVIHCPAFRRLQRKTQILGTDEGDFHRTRLTHSLEVASIGTSLVRHVQVNSVDDALKGLLPSDDLINVICLLHDIGHPPFGHGGEVALNYMMHHAGGFEGNAQSLRLLTKIEDSYGDFGLDLTRRSLLGILKYPVSWSSVAAPHLPLSGDSHQKPIRVNDWLPPKAYYDCEQAEVDWLLAPLSDADRQLFQSLTVHPEATHHGASAYHTFDCSIMDIADDIAYGVHDLEDAIHLRLMTREQIDTPECRQRLAATLSFRSSVSVLDALFDPSTHMRKQAVGELVNYFVTATVIQVSHEAFDEPLLRYSLALLPEARDLLDYLKDSVYNTVINSQESRLFESGGQTVVLHLFEALNANPMHLLDKNSRHRFQQQTNESASLRVICDYIANMTDDHAYRMHARLFGLNTRTMLERK